MLRSVPALGLDAGLRRRVALSCASGEFTVRGLARRAGLSQPLLANWLAGRRGLSMASADAVLDALRLVVTFVPEPVARLVAVAA